MDNIYIRKANYYETDQMGIVHHSNHIRYFEEARLYFMHSIGCDAAEMEQAGIIIPNVDAYAKYEKPIRFSDEVRITVRLEKFNAVCIHCSACRRRDCRRGLYHPLFCGQGF